MSGGTIAALKIEAFGLGYSFVILISSFVILQLTESVRGNKPTIALHRAHLLRTLDDGVGGGFGLGLGVEAVERDA